MARRFEFKQSVMLLRSTGKKARSVAQLRDLIATVSADSISHHMYHYFLKGHILEYTNDFSQWTGESIEERALAEHLSNVDPYEFGDVEQLRQELLRILDLYRERFPEPREARPRDEFFFNEAVILVCSAGIAVSNLAEFLMAIKHVDPGSFYYHFYAARLRQGSRINDFSAWIGRELGKQELADALQSIDPFMHSLEGIREQIMLAVEDEVRRDMETAGMPV